MKPEEKAELLDKKKWLLNQMAVALIHGRNQHSVNDGNKILEIHKKLKDDN